MLAVVLALALAPARAACPTLAVDLADTSRAILRAYEDLDQAAYEAGQRLLLTQLACVNEPLRPAMVAELHRLVGLDAFLAGDEARALVAFRAALAGDPAWVPPKAVFPADHPLHALLAKAKAAPEGGGLSLWAPPDGLLLVDGKPGARVLPGRGAIVQRVGPAGVVTHSAWIGPGTPLPDWLLPPREAEAPPPTTVARAKPRVAVAPLAFGAAAGVTGIAGGALYAVAWSERARFDDPALPRDEIEPTAKRVNGALVGAAAAGGVALACATAAVFTVEW
ncbi:MAG: hypothetical protein ACOZNI_23765 [Myxococcota bacterium]